MKKGLIALSALMMLYANLGYAQQHKTIKVQKNANTMAAVKAEKKPIKADANKTNNKPAKENKKK